jgi:hypothetical protein
MRRGLIHPLATTTRSDKEYPMFWNKRESSYKFTFVGGPLDGYQQQMPFRPAQILAFPVDRNLLAALHGDEPPTTSNITSVAFYEGSQTSAETWRFHFLRSTTPEEAEQTCHQGFRSSHRS